MWVYIPLAILTPTSVSSPASVDSTMLSTESFSMLAQSCTWRTKSLPASGWRGKLRQNASMRRLFGPTLQRSQQENSEAVQTWLSEVSPAPTSATLASEPVSTESGAASSIISSEPLAHWDAATCSWRTSQLSLLEATLTPFLGSWPNSATMLDGAVYARPTLARLMGAIAGGALPGTESNWPTPSVADTMGGHLSRGGDRSTELLLPGMAQKLAASLTGPPDPPTETAGPPSLANTHTSRPQLNPLFVEWLMLGRDGIGLTCICPASATEATASVDSAMPLCPTVPRQHSDSSGVTPSVSGSRENA